MTSANRRIVEETTDSLPVHGEIPIAFTVRSRLRVDLIDAGLGGFHLTEERVDPPYVKDYDAIHGDGPARWLRRWDTSNWGVLSAWLGETRVGGLVVAWNTEGVNMLEGRSDLAMVWDLRVEPDARGKGIGGSLFDAAETWARSRDCRLLKVETQNINVDACRFYASRGCQLGSIDRFAYEELPDEIQMLWYRRL